MTLRGAAAPFRVVGVIAWHLTLLAATLPIFVACLVATVRHGLSWRILLLLVLAVLATWALNVLPQMSFLMASFNDVGRFLHNLGRCTFSAVSVQDYLGMVRRFHPKSDSMSDRDLAARVVPWASRDNPKRLRVVVASSEDADVANPGYFVTFATMSNAWVVLPIAPQQLTEVQYFILLHEIGHTCWASIGPRMVARIHRRRGLWAIPFLAIVIVPDARMLLVLVLLSIFWYVLATLEMRRDFRRARIVDEIRADMYALERCDATWCARYTETHLATRLCSADREQKIEGVAVPRAQAFIDNLRRRRKGQPLEMPPELAAFTFLTGLEAATTVALAFLCGLSISPPSWVRLGLATGVTGVLGLLAFLVVAIDYILGAMVDGSLKIATPREDLVKVVDRAKTISQWLRTRSPRRATQP